jgi:hypothetical protein
MVLLSVVFSRGVLCTEEPSASAHLAHGKTTVLFVNIAWEQQCNFADKHWRFYDGQSVLVIS